MQGACHLACHQTRPMEVRRPLGVQTAALSSRRLPFTNQKVQRKAQMMFLVHRQLQPPEGPSTKSQPQLPLLPFPQCPRIHQQRYRSSSYKSVLPPRVHGLSARARERMGHSQPL